MPRNQTVIPLPKDSQFHLLSDGATNEVSFQVLEETLEIRVGDANRPSSDLRGQIYPRLHGERNIPMSELAAGGGDHLWGRALGDDALIWVDHA